MRFEVHFNHMERSEVLEAYAADKVADVVEHFLHRQDAHVQIWLDAVHSRSQKGVPEYKAEIEVRCSPKKDLFVQKSDADMYSAINQAVDALKLVLREDGKREVHRVKHAQSAPEIAVLLEAESQNEENRKSDDGELDVDESRL